MVLVQIPYFRTGTRNKHETLKQYGKRVKTKSELLAKIDQEDQEWRIIIFQH